MSDVAIRVEGVSKRYPIGAVEQRHPTLRDSLVDAARRSGRSLRSLFRPHERAGRSREEFWALTDLSFEVRRGEILGIVGRNGAGKSTLLKILSRITDPSAGFAEIAGRIGSLLEVGTGFHQELTGRENIYLNGAILGMKRAEITRKFDAIVAFAEVDKFIDTPVKHYSSGMYTRLAFAVAAHLDPEILLVDEVLAVGDAGFQRKCLGRMEESAKEGRTVLFVSHNLGQIRRLCRTGLWLSQGRKVEYGTVEKVTSAYQKSFVMASPEESSHSGFLSWRILQAAATEEEKRVLRREGAFSVEFQFRIDRPIVYAQFSIVLRAPDGSNIAGWRLDGVSVPGGMYNLLCQFESMPVRPGAYYWFLSVWDGARKVDVVHFLPEFVVATDDHSGLNDEWAGVVNIPCRIEIAPAAAALDGVA